MATIPVTKRGAESLKAELHRLKTVDRPAVINAITNALGHENISMPATPEKVWKAAQSASLKQAAE